MGWIWPARQRWPTPALQRPAACCCLQPASLLLPASFLTSAPYSAVSNLEPTGKGILGNGNRQVSPVASVNGGLKFTPYQGCRFLPTRFPSQICKPANFFLPQDLCTCCPICLKCTFHHFPKAHSLSLRSQNKGYCLGEAFPDPSNLKSPPLL